MLFLGFSAGLPLLLVLGTLSFWLREAGVDRATIGYFSWVGLAYGFKWAWSPLVDRLPLPLLTRALGRRRSWLLLSQITIAAALLGMAHTDPTQSLTHMAWFALAVAFASATQDIALDAYRIEAVEVRLQGAMAATYQAGYRLAMITAGAGVLWIAAAFDPSEATYEHAPWRIAYTVMAACMGVGILTPILIREPKVEAARAGLGAETRAREAQARA
ncbi:MAG: AmpG family muropeptide MFS transporter, partial [Thiobacillaceae bacterium]